MSNPQHISMRLEITPGIERTEIGRIGSVKHIDIWYENNRRDVLLSEVLDADFQVTDAPDGVDQRIIPAQNSTGIVRT